MNNKRTVFAQLADFIPIYEFRCCVTRYRGSHKVKSFSCWDQFLCMFFAQLTYRESLRDIEACLRAVPEKLYHMGFSSVVARNTLANANEKRDWRIYADFAQKLISIARDLYIDDDFGVQLDETVYALDSSTIDLCLALFPWAKFRRAKGAIKLHTLIDLRGNIPTFIEITVGKLHDVNILDVLIPEPGSFYVMDRGYVDFKRLYLFHQTGAFFIVRAKSNLKFRRVYSHSINKSTGLRCDQTITLTGFYVAKNYPEKIRRIKYYDAETKKTFIFLTNNFILSTLTVTQLYKCRWAIELFFKWIKQHLRIKVFFGTTENAVKTQIWIAVCTYVLIAIMKKSLKLDGSLYKILQILSIHVFEKVPLDQLLTESYNKKKSTANPNQLLLFDL